MKPAFCSPPISTATRHDSERVVAGERGDDDPRVAECRSLEPARAAVERVREVPDLARAAEAGDGARERHHRQDLPPRSACPRSAPPGRVGDHADLEAETRSRVENPHHDRRGWRGRSGIRAARRRASRTSASSMRRASASLAGRPAPGARRVAPVRRAVEDEVRQQQPRDIVEHERGDDLVRLGERPQHAGDQRPERPRRARRDAHERRRRAASRRRRGRRASTRSTTAPIAPR